MDVTGAEKRAAVLSVVKSLRPGESRSTGQLHRQLFTGAAISRDHFEQVLGAMARAGLAETAEAEFIKDGRRIPYRTVSLTPAAAHVVEDTPLNLILKQTVLPSRGTGKARTPTSTRRSSREKVPEAPTQRHAALSASPLAEKLRLWRSEQAKRRGLPPFASLAIACCT